MDQLTALISVEKWCLLLEEQTPGTYIGSVNGRRPPESESSVWNLVQTRSLGICQLLPFHGLLKATGLLPRKGRPSTALDSIA